jgi:hypothetical protein
VSDPGLSFRKLAALCFIIGYNSNLHALDVNRLLTNHEQLSAPMALGEHALVNGITSFLSASTCSVLSPLFFLYAI